MARARFVRNSPFQVGGTLIPGMPSYVKRTADRELLELVRAGRSCHILTTRQMGKSSLMVHAAERLRAESVVPVIIDLTFLGTSKATTTADQWYFGIAHAVFDKLGLAGDLKSWWISQDGMALPMRLRRFFRDVVLAQITGPVAVFVDAVECAQSLDFARDFFGVIRECQEDRTQDQEYCRLTFVLLGTCHASDQTEDPLHHLVRVGPHVALTDFTADEVRPLGRWLVRERARRGEILGRILDWTDGHPYLTQKVCRLCKAQTGGGRRRVTPQVVDQVVSRDFLAPASDLREDNLIFVRQRFELGGNGVGRLLELYQLVLRGERVLDDPTSPLQMELKLTGLLKPNRDGWLRVRNQIYARVFNPEWIRAIALESGEIRTPLAP